MKFEAHPSITLPVRNFDLQNNNNDTFRKHGNLFPTNVRCVICGPSNCGKTNLLMTLLTNENGLRFENIYIYSKTLYQDKYKLLETILTPISGINYYQFSDSVDFIHPNNAQSNSIIVFDDISTDPQNCMRMYYCMGRHKNIDSFCLIQTYTHIAKHLIRDNVNFLVLFKQDDLNLRHVYNDHVNTDMSFQSFKELCTECWKESYGFLVIDKESEFGSGRYRKGFDQFLTSL